MDTTFAQEYGTNIAGTITAALIFGIAWCVKNKCRHSKIAINSGCIQCEADDTVTIREDPRRPPPIRRIQSRDEGEV